MRCRMKGFFQSYNRIYCLTNIFVCILCTGYLYTGYCSVNNEVQQEVTNEIVENDTEPLSENNSSNEVKQNETTKKTVVTSAKSNTSSKKYVKPNYDAVTGSAVVDYAKNYLGLRYVSGGNSLTTGTDCSGFTKLIYKEFGITLSRSVKSQVKNGTYVKKSDLQKGDLIFYGHTSSKVSHVAIYIGNGKVIHQSTPKSGVKINTMNMMVYITARRVITQRAQTFPEMENGDQKEDSNINTEDNVNNNINSGTTSDNTTNNSSDNNTIVETPNETTTNETSKENSGENYTNSEYGTSN